MKVHCPDQSIKVLPQNKTGRTPNVNYSHYFVLEQGQNLGLVSSLCLRWSKKEGKEKKVF